MSRRQVSVEYDVEPTEVVISDSVCPRTGLAAMFNREDSARIINERDTGGMEEIPVTYEEPWSDGHEAYFEDWICYAKLQREAHGKAGHALKRKYRILTFIILLWSSLILITNGLLGCSDVYQTVLVRLLINSIGVFLNALFTSLNIGYTYRLHFEYETKFFEVELDIKKMLLRQRCFRPPLDTFLVEVVERFKKLGEAPELPKSTMFFC